MDSKPDIENKDSVMTVGQEVKVSTLEGERKRCVNLDNAATTPSFKSVHQKVSEFLNYYSSVGRGAGFKSRVSSSAVADARELLLKFVQADKDSHTLIFTKHTTEAINKLAKRFPFSQNDVIISTWLEHHANLLPWRKLEKEKGVDFLQAKVRPDDGAVDVDDLFEKIYKHSEKLKLVSITGASNVTGYLPPIQKIARVVHNVGGYLLVDAAQLAPHRQIDIGNLSSSERIDFLAFSGHKMYAPFGAGVLIGPRRFFEGGEPDQQGGGAVELVTKDSTLWCDPPFKEETGTPNSVGIVAMATAANILLEKGMDKIAGSEEELTKYCIEKLTDIEELSLYGPTDMSQHDKLGIFTFNLDGLHHKLVSSVLSYEHGIATRSGCFCAHPYMCDLLNLPDDIVNRRKKEVFRGTLTNLEGAVRASLGLYNTREDINQLVDALKEILANKQEYTEKYDQDERTGNFFPVKDPTDPRSVFSLNAPNKNS